MIAGLQVTVAGAELVQLADERALHHESRASVYAQQIDNMRSAKVEGMLHSGGDPVKNLEERRARHENDAKELRFIARHIDVAETYLLDRGALGRLGIVSDRY